MRTRGQSVMEYGFFVCLCVAALITAEVYIKRGIQGRLRGYVQEIGEGHGYSPGATNSLYTITRAINENSSSYVQDGFDEPIKKSISETNARIEQDVSRVEDVARP